MPRKIKFPTLIIVLIFFGTILRIIHLQKLPAVSHRDETAIGYNAYSLLKTGRDEHGQTWPIIFESFGDYKLPGLIYSAIPFVNFLGLNQLAVRLPTALFAILTLPLAYWLARQLGWSRKTSTVFLGLLSFSFWHITQARNAYEPISGLFWLVLTWGSWLKARKNKIFYLIAIISYALGSLFYNIPWLLTPFLFFGSVLIDQKHYQKNKRKVTFASLIMVGIVAIGLGWFLREINTGKSGTTVFSSQEVVQKSAQLTHAGLVSGIPSIISRVSNYPLILSIFNIAKNYLASFDPTYLFFLGDHNAWHNLRAIGLGNLNPILILPFLIGLHFLLTNFSKTKHRLTLLYLFISPIVSATTIDAPITNRLLDFHLAVMLVSAVGLVQGFNHLRNTNWGRALILTFGLGYLSIFGLFLLRYFYIFNPALDDAWYPKVTEMIQEVKKVRSNYDAIFITQDLKIGYTYFAFYTPFDPASFIDNALWYKDGFVQVSQYQNYHFKNFPHWSEFNPKNVAQIFNDQTNSILVVLNDKPPKEIEPVFSIIDWRGRWLWSGWETNLEQAYKAIDQLATNQKRVAVLEYLESCLNQKCEPALLKDSISDSLAQ